MLNGLDEAWAVYIGRDAVDGLEEEIEYEIEKILEQRGQRYLAR